MLSLRSFARQTFFLALGTKSLLKVIRHPLYQFLKCPEIPSLNACKSVRCRRYSTQKGSEEIVKSTISESEVPTGTFETVKETTKTASYIGIIAIGIGITGIVLYAVFSELFSRNSAVNIYSKALERCLKNEKVIMSLGEPIIAFGEESSRGRRQHTNHLLYKKDGTNYLRMKFYIKGSRKKATVHLEMKENESSNFDYRYLFVQLDDYPYTTIVLEDNRNEKPSLLQPNTKGTLELT